MDTSPSDMLPKELMLIIASYLDTVEDLNNFIEAQELQLVNKDYIQIFIFRYYKYYRLNINKYNVKEVYEGFMRITSLLGTITLTIEDTILIFFNVTWNRFKKSMLTKMSPEYRQFIKYLIMNNFMKNNLLISDMNLRISDVNVISSLDDLEIFLYAYQNTVHTGIFDDDFRGYTNFLINNSHNILKYLFDNKLWDIKKVEKTLDEIFSHELTGLDLRTIELSVEYINTDVDILFKLLMKYLDANDSFHYIFNKLSNIEITVDVFLTSLNNTIKLEYGTYKTFKIVWEKWSHLLTPRQMVHLYKSFYNDDNEFEVDIAIITLIANHEIIRDHYLK